MIRSEIMMFLSQTLDGDITIKERRQISLKSLMITRNTKKITKKNCNHNFNYISLDHDLFSHVLIVFMYTWRGIFSISGTRKINAILGRKLCISGHHPHDRHSQIFIYVQARDVSPTARGITEGAKDTWRKRKWKYPFMLASRVRDFFRRWWEKRGEHKR